MRKPYCCDASRDLFEQYYANQQRGGSNFPVYVGVQRQRGHGIGNVLAGWFRKILPFVKAIAPHALRSGANIIDDVSKGKSFKDAAMSRVPEALSKVVFSDKAQSGSGLRWKRTKATRRKRTSVKRRRRDIFS
jgi:hypothetical protein